MSDTLANALAGEAPTIKASSPVVVNPLAGIATAQEMVGRMQGLDKSLAERNAGRAYRNAIDQNGEFSPEKLRQGLAADPTTDYAAGTTLANTQNISDQQLAQARAKAGWVNSSAGALTALGPNITEQDALGVLQQGRTAGILTPAELERQTAEVKALGGDPAKLNAWANQHQYTGASTQQQIERRFGKPFTQDTGGQVVGGTQSVTTGGLSTGAIPKAMTPAELNEPVNMPDPRKTLSDGSPNPDYGRQKPFTRREQLEMTGNTVLPDGRVIPPGGQQGPPGQLGTGRYQSVPSTLRGPNAQQPQQPGQLQPSTTQQPPPPQPQQRPITQLSSGEQGQITESGPLFQRDANAATDAQTQHAMLGNMLADTAQFVPGPGAAGAEKFKAAMLTWAAPVARAFGIDPANVAAQQSFDKLAAQIADGQSKAGSDSRLALVMAATPHSGLTKEGVDLILRQLQGNADFIVAKSKLADAYPNRSDYAGFQRTIRELDPRVFQYDRMTDEQKGTWLHALDPRAQRAFMKSHKWAEDKGLIGAD